MYSEKSEKQYINMEPSGIRALTTHPCEDTLSRITQFLSITE